MRIHSMGYLVVVLLSGCQAVAPPTISDHSDARLLRGDEVAALLVGKSTYAKHDRIRGRMSWVEYVQPNGTAILEEGGVIVAGPWRFDGDSFCVAYEIPGDDVEHCALLYRSGESIFYVNAEDPDGEIIGSISRIAEGDTENLVQRYAEIGA